jgi:CRISPR/Cas system-associated exonuclease Cas4 (RecB family)
MFQFDDAILEQTIRRYHLPAGAPKQQVVEQLGNLKPLLDLVLQHAPWSVSKSEVIAKCGLMYAWKYGNGSIQKIPEIKPYIEATIGVVVHKTLELALSDNFDNASPPISPAQRVKTSMAIAIDTYPYEEKKKDTAAPLTHDEIEQVSAFFDQIVTFIAKMDDRKKRFGSRMTFQERQWGISPTFMATPFFDPYQPKPKEGEAPLPVKHQTFFRGVVDYGMFTTSQHMIIIDHKSGKVKPLDKTASQCKAYCVMAVVQHPEIKGVQTAINYILHNEEPWNPHVSASEIRREYFPWLLSFVMENARNLLNPEPRPSKGWYCSWCGYKPICPKHGGHGPG